MLGVPPPRNTAVSADTPTVSGVHADRDAERRSRFEEVFRAHHRSVARFVAARYPTVDGGDLVALTFEVAWRRLDDAPIEAVRGWLCGIARNHARNAIRQRSRQRRLAGALATGPSGGVSWLHDERLPIEVAERLAAALGQLSEADRETIELAAFAGLSGADLGAALGVSAGAASVRLHRARQRLADFYEVGR
ncbi:MAG: hypothetical protein RI958_493 [Actinomycetota bacterium]|jgi:RNA polymerase sigma-70 factor (ECF subfamily)